MLLLIGASIIFVLFLCFDYIKDTIVTLFNDITKVRKLPGPPITSKLLGHSQVLFGTPPESIFQFLRKWAKSHYPIYKLFTLHRSAANILSPEDCELIMSNPIHMEKGQIYDMLHGWLKTGLLTSTGKKWQIRRKILTPAFHFNILQEFIAIFNEETEKLVEIFKEKCEESFINITPYLTQFTLKTIAETAMGTKLEFSSKKEKKYKQAIFDMGEILVYTIVRPWFINQFYNMFNPYYFKQRKALRILHKFTSEMITEREKNFKDIEIPSDEYDVYKGKKRLAMLDLLLTAKNKEHLINDEGIREEVDTFLFEGHDTTSVALGFTLLLLACNKNAQENIVQEMEDILGSLDKKPTFNNLQEMKYMERCIKEALRLYPSVHFISRKLGEDLVTHEGYLLPKNSTVFIHIFDVHRNPKIYPEPEKFDPDRFLPENCVDRHPYAYLPFSAGPRNCIGQRFAILEMKAALCGILSNFILEPVDTPDSIVLVVDIVLRTKNGIKIKLIPRK